MANQLFHFLVRISFGQNIYEISYLAIVKKNPTVFYFTTHYSESDTPRPDLYAEMVAEDRRLKLTGYEVYRFGRYEFEEIEKAKQTITDFFSELFKFHYIS